MTDIIERMIKVDIKEEMVKRLKSDCDVLIRKKIPKALENISDEKGVNTYRNLTRALADNIKLIGEYEWRLMYSEYIDETDPSNPVKQVAVWEQNYDGTVKNHKKWDIADDKNELKITANILDGEINEKVIDKIIKSMRDSIENSIDNGRFINNR